MDDLTAFLAFVTARLDEDEAAAETWREHDERPLREVAAKRAIINTLTSRTQADDSEAATWHQVGYGRARYDVLRLMAAVYDSHPDYRPEWRP